MLPEYIIVGILVGFLSGLLGVGGGLITTPVLKMFFGLPSLVALATPLPVIIPTALAGVYGYLRKGFVNKRIAFWVVLGGLPFTIIGALGTKVIPSFWLMIMTGVFVIIVGVRLLYSAKFEEEPTHKQVPIVLTALLIGLITGLFAGLLALGGGFIMIPAFLLVFGLPIKEAIATSLFSIVFFSIPGTVVHSHLHHIDWRLVFNLSLGVIPSSYLGAQVGIRIKSKKLLTIFSVFFILFGIYFIWNQISDL